MDTAPLIEGQESILTDKQKKTVEGRWLYSSERRAFFRRS